jgi:hypothetical protein
MPYRVTFVVDLFRGPHELKESHAALQFMLDCLYNINCMWLRAHPEAPRVYASGIVERNPGRFVAGAVPKELTGLKRSQLNKLKYEEEPLGQEDWKDIPTCLRDGIADCEDLACWRAAELTVRDGIPARPSFTYKVRPNGSYLYHITVLYPDGSREDPSRLLGMGAHQF